MALGNLVNNLAEGVGIAFDAMRANKVRAGLTIMGVAVGVFDEVGKTYGLLRLPVPGRAEKVAASE